MDHYLDELLKPSVGDVTLTIDDGRTMRGTLGYEIDDRDGSWIWYVRAEQTRYHFLEDDVIAVDHEDGVISIRA